MNSFIIDVTFRSPARSVAGRCKTVARGQPDLIAASRSRKLQCRIDRFGIFPFEPRDQFGGRQDLADAADALPAAPDFLPGLRLGTLARGVGAETHLGCVG